MFGKGDKANEVYGNFIDAWGKNKTQLYTYIFFVFFYFYVFQFTRFKVKGIDLIVVNTLSGILLVLFYIFIIYLLKKLKIIKRTQILSTILVMVSITVIFGYIYIYFLMNSLTDICKKKIVEKKNSDQMKDIITIMLFVSIMILLFLQDTENWKQYGYFIFFLISIFILLCLFYYSAKYPSIGILSLWGLIEWILVLIYRKDASFNSVHFMLMKS
jgi:hypothetical protein